METRNKWQQQSLWLLFLFIILETLALSAEGSAINTNNKLKSSKLQMNWFAFPCMESSITFKHDIVVVT